jgi:hypothetical protein
MVNGDNLCFGAIWKNGDSLFESTGYIDNEILVAVLKIRIDDFVLEENAAVYDWLRS